MSADSESVKTTPSNLSTIIIIILCSINDHVNTILYTSGASVLYWCLEGLTSEEHTNIIVNLM